MRGALAFAACRHIIPWLGTGVGAPETGSSFEILNPLPWTATTSTFAGKLTGAAYIRKVVAAGVAAPQVDWKIVSRSYPQRSQNFKPETALYPVQGNYILARGLAGSERRAAPSSLIDRGLALSRSLAWLEELAAVDHPRSSQALYRLDTLSRARFFFSSFQISEISRPW